MKKRIFFALLVTAVICVSAGCRGDGEEQPSAPVRDLGNIPMQLKDIPAPAGFAFMPGQSYVIQAGRIRPASTLVYRGVAQNVPDTAAFYLSTMREIGWNPTGINANMAEQVILTFENSREICGIHINMFNKDVVVVTIRIDCK